MRTVHIAAKRYWKTFSFIATPATFLSLYYIYGYKKNEESFCGQIIFRLWHPSTRFRKLLCVIFCSWRGKRLRLRFLKFNTYCTNRCGTLIFLAPRSARRKIWRIVKLVDLPPLVEIHVRKDLESRSLEIKKLKLETSSSDNAEPNGTLEKMWSVAMMTPWWHWLMERWCSHPKKFAASLDNWWLANMLAWSNLTLQWCLNRKKLCSIVWLLLANFIQATNLANEVEPRKLLANQTCAKQFASIWLLEKQRRTNNFSTDIYGLMTDFHESRINLKKETSREVSFFV